MDHSLSIDIRVPGTILIANSELKIAQQQRYGLVGYNGSGKTTLLKHVHSQLSQYVLYVDQEVSATNKSVFHTVLEANAMRENLFNKLKDTSQLSLEQYNQVHEELVAIDAYKDKAIVRKLLYGLGFTLEEQEYPTHKFSGGWRMRISLAKALYIEPPLLLLDEPTNHLDINATIWLTNYLAKYKNTLIVVSHNRDFLNDVCTNIIHIFDCKLFQYSGNYDAFEKAHAQYIVTRNNKWHKVQRIVREMRNKSTPRKEVKAFLDANNDKAPSKPYRVNIYLNNIIPISVPAITITNLAFGYEADRLLLININSYININTRTCIVGKNGVGKSTFLKLLIGDIQPVTGSIDIHRRIRLGYYHQHSADVLPKQGTPIDYIRSINPKLKLREIRQHLGSIGLDGKTHVKPMHILSGGQKARVAFVGMYVKKPHIVLLDEPTNHLDIQTIDALIKTINGFNGGVIMITHNIDLIQRTDCALWELEDGYIKETYLDAYETKVWNSLADI